MRFDALRLACGAALALSGHVGEAGERTIAVGGCGTAVPGYVRIPADPDEGARDPAACHAAARCVRRRLVDAR